MPLYRVELRSQENEQRRSVSIGRVPCPKCGNDPILRGGYKVGPDSSITVPACPECEGRGDVPATADSAVAYVEAMEREYAKFRLDDPLTIARYPALTSDSLALVQQTVKLHRKDTHHVDGRFLRAGKVTPTGAPGFVSTHRGWLAFHEQEKPYKVHRVGDLAELMAVTGGQYGHAQIAQLDGTRTVDWNSDTIKTALTTSTYSPDIDANDTFSNVTNEITGTNYTAGGWTLTTPTVTYDTATDQLRADADDVSQATATFTARIAVTYKSTGTASTSPLICFLNFGADVSPSAGTFTITWDATGIYIRDVT